MATGSGNGIDTLVVVDVQSLHCGQPMSRISPTDKPTNRQPQHILQKERKYFRENKEKLTDYIRQTTFKKLNNPERWSQYWLTLESNMTSRKDYLKDFII